MSQRHSESLSASDEMDPLERVLLRAGISRKTVSSTSQKAQPPWLGRSFFDLAGQPLLRSSKPVSVVKMPASLAESSHYIHVMLREEPWGCAND